MWGELAKDASGILLFLAWLALPPVYTAVIGRHYTRLCTEAAQNAVWAHEELRQALDGVEELQANCQCPQSAADLESMPVPRARDQRPEDTEELVPVADSDGNGRHRLAPSRLASANS